MADVEIPQVPFFVEYRSILFLLQSLSHILMVPSIRLLQGVASKNKQQKNDFLDKMFLLVDGGL